MMAELGSRPRSRSRWRCHPAIAIYVDMASFVINELKQIALEAR